MEGKIPTINWVKDFPDGEIPSSGNPNCRVIIIAIDSEYQTGTTAYTNLCLSYQFALYDVSDGIYQTGIFFPDFNKNERFSLTELLYKIFDKSGINPLGLHNYRIIVVAHYFSAEWAMLSDKKDLYMKFEYIRKSMVTAKPLETVLFEKDSKEDGCSVFFWFDVRDTMLLLPDGYRSLEKASTFLEGFEKIPLDDSIKANMYEFLQKDPNRFIEYAIRDAEVTLKLFIKLQFLLNAINMEEEKLFLTLAGATTNDFIDYSKEAYGTEYHNLQFDRKHSVYKEFEALATRSYMGGLNSSYHVGKAKGYTFIDIDFKNAYPTAMNLIEIGMFGTPPPKKQEKKKETHEPELTLTELLP